MGETTGPESRGFRVRGRVQGVGFRWWTERTANELGLAGWVRNCADGSVEVQARGEAAVLERLEALLREGPSAARVSGVERMPAGVVEGTGGFRIEA